MTFHWFIAFAYLRNAQLDVVWLWLMPFSVHQAHLSLMASFFGVRFCSVIGLWALTFLDGLGERDLGLDV